MKKTARSASFSLTLLIFSFSTSSAEALFHAESGPQPTAFVELYTSEGCSSCPPADEWFSMLRDWPGLWTDFVPVGFHVDYWDYLGWKDRFASPEFTGRQRKYSDLWQSISIYTPMLVKNGFELRNSSAIPALYKRLAVIYNDLRRISLWY